jgi:hypothetical protein
MLVEGAIVVWSLINSIRELHLNLRLQGYQRLQQIVSKLCLGGGSTRVSKGARSMQCWMLLEEFLFISAAAQMIISDHVYRSFEPP